jgi:hypothetical protein
MLELHKNTGHFVPLQSLMAVHVLVLSNLHFGDCGDKLLIQIYIYFIYFLAYNLQN